MEKRSKNIEVILYYENVPMRELLIDYLQSLHINCYLSPLHDKDVYKSGDKKGQLKKAHYHLAILFDSLKTIQQVVDLFADYKVTPQNVKFILSVVGELRYLCHLDDKGKQLYKPADVWCPYDDYGARIMMDKDKHQTSRALLNLLYESKCTEFARFVQLVMDLDNDDYLSAVMSNAYFYDRIIKSNFYTKKSDIDLTKAV